MHALWRELGYAGEEYRDERLNITGRILGRELDSSATLTYAEADTVIEALKDRRDKVKAQQQDGGES